MDQKDACSLNELKNELEIGLLSKGGFFYDYHKRGPIEVRMCSSLNHTGVLEGFEWINKIVDI